MEDLGRDAKVEELNNKRSILNKLIEEERDLDLKINLYEDKDFVK